MIQSLWKCVELWTFRKHWISTVAPVVFSISLFTFEHIELRAKLLDYFLRSHKSNINQSYMGELPQSYDCKFHHEQDKGLVNGVQVLVKWVTRFAQFLCVFSSTVFPHLCVSSSPKCFPCWPSQPLDCHSKFYRGFMHGWCFSLVWNVREFMFAPDSSDTQTRILDVCVRLQQMPCPRLLFSST